MYFYGEKVAFIHKHHLNINKNLQAIDKTLQELFMTSKVWCNSFIDKCQVRQDIKYVTVFLLLFGRVRLRINEKRRLTSVIIYLLSGALLNVRHTMQMLVISCS